MAVTLATAYIDLIPSFRGGAAAISRGLDGPAASAGRSSGALAGREFQGALGSSLGGVGSTVQSKLGRPIVSTLDKAGADGARAIEARLARADLAGSLTAVGGGALLAGGAAVAGFVKAGQAAADLNAAIATSEQVFDSQAAAISTWAKTSSDNFGLSQRAATEAATSFAVFGKAADFAGPELVDFSTSLVELSADFAAFKNTTPEDALTAISAALRGEFDPIEKYGILLNELTLKEKARELGIYEGSAALTSQQKVIAAHAAIMEQSGDITGQFTREQGELGTSMAELNAKWEDAQAALGQALLPAMTAAAEAATGVLDAFSELSPETQKLIGGIGGIAAVGVTAVGGLALLVGGGMRAVDTFRQFGERVRATDGPLGRMSGRMRDVNGNLTTMGRAAKGVQFVGMAAGALLAADAIYNMTRNALDLEDTLNRIKLLGPGASTESVLGALNSRGDQLQSLKDQILGPLTDNAVFVDPAGAAAAPLDNLERSLKDLIEGGQLDAARQGLEALRDAANFDVNNEDEEEMLAIYEALIPVLDRAAGAQAAANGAAADTSAIGILNSLYTKTASAADVLAFEEKQAEDATKELDSAMAGLNRRQTLSTLAFDAAAAAAQGYSNAIERSTNADNLASAALGAGRALRGLRDGFKVEADESEAAKETTDALTTALDKLRDAATNADPKLSALGIRFSTLATAGDAFRDAIANSSLFDDQVSGALRLGDAYRDFRNTFRRLPADIDLNDALMGKYGRRVQEAITNIKELGVAAVDYLATLIKSGRTSEEVQREAARLREEYAAQLRQLGLNEEQINKYLELMGLTPKQVTTSIEIAGREKARFELNAHLQLLEGKIPTEIATEVSALIHKGDVEAAAARLAQFAASNPVPIDIDPEVDEEKVAQAKAKLAPIFDFDFGKLALGQYTEEQENLLDAVLQFGDASTDYIANLAAIEGGQVRAKAEAVKLREALVETLRQNGIVDPNVIAQLVELAGLSEEQIDFAITMSGFEETVFKINTLLALIEEDLDPDRKRLIAIAIAKGDYDEALRLINEDVAALEKNGVDIPVVFDWSHSTLTEEDFEGVPTWLTPNQFRADATVPVAADFTEADETYATWRNTITGELVKAPLDASPGGAYKVLEVWTTDAEGKPVTVPLDSESKLADETLGRWRNRVTGEIVQSPLSASPGHAYELLGIFHGYVERTEKDAPIGADLTDAQREVEAWQPPNKSITFTIDTWVKISERDRALLDETLITGPRVNPGPGRPDWDRVTPQPGTRAYEEWNRRTGGIDGNKRTPMALGGLVGGSFSRDFTAIGTDTVPSMLRPGEFVVTTKGVADVGPAFLDAINRGDFDPARIRGASVSLPNVGIFPGEGSPKDPVGPLGPGEMSEKDFARQFPTLYAAMKQSGSDVFAGGKASTLGGGYRAQSVPTPTLQLEAPEQPSPGAQFGDITVVSPNPRLSAEALVRRMDDELWLRS